MEGKYIEFVENSVYNRGVMINVSNYKNVRRNYEAYTSLFMFNQEVVDYVKNNISPKSNKPSIEGYIGECSASYMWIDIDIEGQLPLATQKMIEVVSKIEAKYGLTYRSIIVYFSGSKGYHIGIPTKCFGCEDYSSDILPKVFKTMVRAMTDNTSGVDYKIYNTSRLFRAPYSRHPKTLMYKIPLDFPKMSQGDFDNMMQMSEFCTPHCEYKIIPEFSEKLQKLFDDTVQNTIVNVDLYEDDEGYQTAISLSSNSSIFRLPKQGERNDLIYRMAYRLFCQKELKVNEVSDIMKFVYEITNEYSAKKGVSRYSEMEFRISINSAYSRTRLKPVTSMKAINFADMVVSMFDKIRKSKYVPTFLSDITDDLKGGWKFGNLYCLIGKGGTMKSYLLQEEVIRTAMERKKPALFCNLEMSQVEWFDRVWMALFMESMSDMITKGSVTEYNIQKLAFEVKEKMANYLHYFAEPDIEPEDVKNIVHNKEVEIKEKLELVGIDSVGGMKMYSDSEAITALKLSKYLKEAAKDTNTPILLINHARNDCPDILRDCAGFVRGGSKFVDNCDAYLSLSKVIDRDKSNFEKVPQDIVYNPKFKYVRFVNKRGSGNTINKIIEFDGSGRIVTVDLEPSEFEVSSFNSGGYEFPVR